MSGSAEGRKRPEAAHYAFAALPFAGGGVFDSE